MTTREAGYQAASRREFIPQEFGRNIMKFARWIFLFLATLGSAALAQSELPAKMQGKWTTGAIGNTRVGGASVELVRMESPDKAAVKVTLTETVGPPHGYTCIFGTVDTVAERTGEAWKISVPHRRCAAYTMTLTPAAGKQRLEGQVSNDMGGSGTVFLEW